jgi:hypothetical protein
MAAAARSAAAHALAAAALRVPARAFALPAGPASMASASAAMPSACEEGGAFPALFHPYREGNAGTPAPVHLIRRHQLQPKGGRRSPAVSLLLVINNAVANRPATDGRYEAQQQDRNKGAGTCSRADDGWWRGSVSRLRGRLRRGRAENDSPCRCGGAATARREISGLEGARHPSGGGPGHLWEG